MLTPLLLLLFALDKPRVDMVITVEREAQPRDEVGAAVTVLHREDLQKLPVESLSEALALVPGITMLSEGGTDGAPMVTSRGFFGGGEVEYMRLLIDGVPAADAESGLADWHRLRLGGIERVEIVHGPGSAAYGDAALGGVVQVFTRGADEARLTAGSFGGRGAEISYAADLGGMRLGLRGDVVTTDGFREHARRDDRSAQLTLDRLRNSTRWRLSLDAAWKDRDEPGPLTRAEAAADRRQSNALFAGDGEQTRRQRLAATFESGAARVVAYAGRRTTDSVRTILFAPPLGVTAARNIDTRDGGLTADVSLGSVHAGADLAHAHLRSVSSLSVSSTRTAAGAFLTGAWNVCARCRLSLGVRRDQIRDRDAGPARRSAATSPRAALTIRASDNTSLFLQVSRAFKAATLDQLFDRGGPFTISNPSLRPQRARNIEAGAGGAKWSLVAYRMNVTDEIDFDARAFAYRNIGSSVHRGVEASATFGAATLSYAWTRVADAANRGAQLKNIPEHVAQAVVRASLPRAIEATVALRWTHGRWLDDDGRFAAPDVARADLRLSRAFGPARLNLDLLNAGGARYDDLGYVLADLHGRPVPLVYPAPRRSARMGVTWTF